MIPFLFILLLFIPRPLWADRIVGEWVVDRGESALDWASLSRVLHSRVRPLEGTGRFGLVVGAVRLRSTPRGVRIQPNFLYRALPLHLSLPVKLSFVTRADGRLGDPLFAQSWGLFNEGQAVGTLSAGTPRKDIGAVPAWEIHGGDGKVIVAVLDSGVDLNHEDLVGALWRNVGETPLNGVDDDQNGFVDDVFGWNVEKGSGDVQDDGSHGTFCAGVIAADAGNDKGSRGVVHARVMTVKFLDKNGLGSTAGAIAAIDYAVKNGARVLNASWGGTEYDQALYDAVSAAGSKGALLVAASGNDGHDNDAEAHPIFPASFRLTNVISVAAYDNRDRLASFSNFGKETVHLGAPGVQILSTTPGGYRLGDGTSFAAPFVSGVAALVLSYLPSLSAASVRDRLLATSEVVGYYEKERTVSAGRIHAWNALSDTRPPRPVAPTAWLAHGTAISTPHPYSNSVSFREVIRSPGATHVRAHFQRFETEKGVDRVVLKDGTGELVAVYSGKKPSFWSADALGDSLIIEFESDESFTAYGFDIDSYETSTARSP